MAVGLPSEEYLLATTVLDGLGAVAGEEQFEIGLIALTFGLVTSP